MPVLLTFTEDVLEKIFSHSGTLMARQTCKALRDLLPLRNTALSLRVTTPAWHSDADADANTLRSTTALLDTLAAKIAPGKLHIALHTHSLADPLLLAAPHTYHKHVRELEVSDFRTLFTPHDETIARLTA